MDAAHVVPDSDPRITDEPWNGVALNTLLHRACDAGLLGLLPGGKTARNERYLANLEKQNLAAGLDLVRGLVPKVMTLPNSPEFVPPDEYLRQGLKSRGWTDMEITAASA